MQDIGDETLFIKTYKQRLINCYSQKLNSDIVSSPEASHYQHYKTRLTVEEYLSLDLSYKFHKILSNFRCSTHELMIEKGRRNNFDRDLRYCPLCSIAHVKVVVFFFLPMKTFPTCIFQYIGYEFELKNLFVESWLHKIMIVYIELPTSFVMPFSIVENF